MYFRAGRPIKNVLHWTEYKREIVSSPYKTSGREYGANFNFEIRY